MFCTSCVAASLALRLHWCQAQAMLGIGSSTGWQGNSNRGWVPRLQTHRRCADALSTPKALGPCSAHSGDLRGVGIPCSNTCEGGIATPTYPPGSAGAGARWSPEVLRCTRSKRRDALLATGRLREMVLLAFNRFGNQQSC